MRDKSLRDGCAQAARAEKEYWRLHPNNPAGQKNVRDLEKEIRGASDFTEENPAEPYRARLYDAIERQVGEPTLPNILTGISQGVGKDIVLELQTRFERSVRFRNRAGDVFPTEVLKAIRDYKPKET